MRMLIASLLTVLVVSASISAPASADPGKDWKACAFKGN